MKTLGTLLKPLITEKASALQANSVYAFVVAPTASKGAIALAFRETYGVKPLAIRTVLMDGKNVRFGKYSGTEKRFKKAFVTVPKGTTIPVTLSA